MDLFSLFTHSERYKIACRQIENQFSTHKSELRKFTKQGRRQPERDDRVWWVLRAHATRAFLSLTALDWMILLLNNDHATKLKQASRVLWRRMRMDTNLKGEHFSGWIGFGLRSSLVFKKLLSYLHAFRLTKCNSNWLDFTILWKFALSVLIWPNRSTIMMSGKVFGWSSVLSKRNKFIKYVKLALATMGDSVKKAHKDLKAFFILVLYLEN